MKHEDTHATQWEWFIRPESYWFEFNLKQLWSYRHLLLRLVRRDFLIHHQQTLLGPLWIIIQPLLVLLTYTLIFDKAVGLSTDGLPPYLFYFAGIIVWSLFAESFTGTAFTFTHHATLFNKVYFPRMIIPLAVVVMNIIRFSIQFCLFFLMLVYYRAQYDFQLYPLRWLPALIGITAVVGTLAVGLGMIFSTITAKYRDLVNLIHLGIRLMMFATPVIYPLSILHEPVRTWVAVNPLTPLIEFFRYAFLGRGSFDYAQLLVSLVMAVVTAGIGAMLFNKYSTRLQDVL